MRKKILLLFTTILFFILTLQAFALNADIIAQRQGDSIKTQLTIESKKTGNLKIKEIQGLENFNILSRSQSQSSSNSTVIINGKTQSKNVTTLSLQMNLQPNASGTLTLGPAVITNGYEEITTNSVKIPEDGNIIIQGNNISQKQKKNIQVLTDEKIHANKKKKTQTGIKQTQSLNIIFYIFPIIFLVGLLSLYFYIKQYPNLFSSSKKTKGAEKKNKEINFEIQTENIDFPLVTDKNFIKKTTKIFKLKLAKLYNIENIENKTFGEMLDFIPDKKKDNIKSLIQRIQKAQYGNIIEDKQKILDGIKNL